MISGKLKSRLDKIHALAVRGISGEKDAAKNRLLVVLAKHGLTMEDYLPGSEWVKAKVPEVVVVDYYNTFRVFLRGLGGTPEAIKALLSYFGQNTCWREDFGNKKVYFLYITPVQFKSELYKKLVFLARFSEYQVDVASRICFSTDEVHIRFIKREIDDKS